MVLSLWVTLRLSLFLSTEALIISQNSLRQTLSTSLSQAPPFIAVGLTHPQRHRHQSSMSPTHQLSQAADQPQAHTTICLRPTSPITSDPLLFRSLSLSSFLAPIGSHITRLTSNRSIMFHFALIIAVYDHWSMIGAGLVSWYRIGQSIKHGFRFGCVDFSGFLFCSSSLVLIGTVGLWLCNDFYGFDDGCGGVLVVEWNIILL